MSLPYRASDPQGWGIIPSRVAASQLARGSFAAIPRWSGHDSGIGSAKMADAHSSLPRSSTAYRSLHLVSASITGRSARPLFVSSYVVLGGMVDTTVLRT